MKLYFAPGACSMAPHIILSEAVYRFELEKVDLANKQTERGENYLTINPKGYVPALQLDEGEILTEVAVILQYLADQKPESRLVPKPGTMERYRLMEWLNFISSELHKLFGSLFSPKIPAEWRENQLERLGQRFDYLTHQLSGKLYLAGDSFTVADAYLFTVLNWSSLLKVDLNKWPRLQDYLTQVATRPSVQETMMAEGLRH